MDPPQTDGGGEREKLEEVKDGGPMHHCNLFDTEVTHKIAQAFLPGLASACVDNTTGGLFKSPGSVAVDIRKEMVDALIQRSENFVAEAVVLEGGAETEVPEHPYDIISDFIDDFTSSKRNFFSRVSGWLLSDRREDHIDDFVQEMEINGFWLIARRESVAQTLLKNVDFKDAFHCNKKFNTPEELTEHLPQCSFRTVDCPNEGCDAQFTAGNMEIHDAVCPFKMLPCEQKCSDILMRRDMDRHCITVCPMKLVTCPFSSVGCESTIPRCKLEEHKLENVRAHVLCILQTIYKEAATPDLEHRVDQLEKLSSPQQLAKGQNVRSLTTLIRNLEKKLGPLEVSKKPETTNSEESTESSAQKDEHMESSNKKEEHPQPQSENKSIASPDDNKDSVESLAVKKELSSSPANSKSTVEVTAKKELKESPTKNETIQSPPKEQHSSESPDGKDLSNLQPKKEDSPTKDSTVESQNKEQRIESSTVVKDPPAKTEEHTQPLSDNKSTDSTKENKDSVQSPPEKKEPSSSTESSAVKSPTKNEAMQSPAKEENSTESSAAITKEHKVSSEEHGKLPSEQNEGTNSSMKKEEHDESLVKEDDQKTSPVKREEHGKTLVTGEESSGSPMKNKEPLQESKVHEESKSPSSSEKAES